MNGSISHLTYLSTSEVAHLLNVHASTVKRWANSGLLDVEVTEGRHRRIELGSVLKVAREQGHETFLAPFFPHESAVWHAVRDAISDHDFDRVEELAMKWLVQGETDRVTALFAYLGTVPDLALPVLFDDGVRRFMRSVGDAWERGQIGVSDEHLATQALLEALFRVRAGSRGGAAPASRGRTAGGRRLVAVVGTMEGNEHHLGALCIRLLLERLGHDVVYLGPNVPIEEFSAVQQARGADLVCISVMPPGSPADMVRCIRVLQNFYRPDSPFALLLGGTAMDSTALHFPMGEGHPFRALEIFDSSRGFVEWVKPYANGHEEGARA